MIEVILQLAKGRSESILLPQCSLRRIRLTVLNTAGAFHQLRLTFAIVYQHSIFQYVWWLEEALTDLLCHYKIHYNTKQVLQTLTPATNTNINPVKKEDASIDWHFFKAKLQNVELAENNVHWHLAHAVRPVTFKFMGREVMLTLAGSPRSQNKLVLEKWQYVVVNFLPGGHKWTTFWVSLCLSTSRMENMKRKHTAGPLAIYLNYIVRLKDSLKKCSQVSVLNGTLTAHGNVRALFLKQYQSTISNVAYVHLHSFKHIHLPFLHCFSFKRICVVSDKMLIQ